MRIFGDENIMINDTLEEIMKELQDEDSFWYKPLFPYLKSETADSGGIARGLTAYYNQKGKRKSGRMKSKLMIVYYIGFSVT